MNAAELKEIVIRLQEINVGLSEIYKERAMLQGKLFTDPSTGPALLAAGEVSTPEGYTVRAEKKDPEDCSEYERKNSMKAPTGEILKLKLSLPKVQK